jgi:PKD repeat protein
MSLKVLAILGLSALGVAACSPTSSATTSSPSHAVAGLCSAVPSGEVSVTSHLETAVPSGATVGQEFTVEPGQLALSVAISWDTPNHFWLTLIAPSGRFYDRHTTDPWAYHTLASTAESLAIGGPESGDWQVQVFGINGSGGLVRIDLTQTPTAATGAMAAITASTDRGVAPVSIRFSASAAGTGKGSLASFQWDFGDCSPVDSASNPTHVFTRPGKFTVTLKAVDSAGQPVTGTHHVLVTATDQPPIAMFTAATLDGGAPTTVSFDARGSYDVDGRVTSFEWDYGDGSSGFGESGAHKYSKWGSYSVILKLVDDDGLSSSTCQVIATGEGPGLPPVPCPG